MAKELSQSKRGMSFEKQIAETNERYEKKGLAVIQKIPTPTRNIRGRIVYAEKSTVDFMGSYGDGVSIAFEAKEVSNKTNFPLVKRYKGKDVETVLEHQRQFLFRWPGVRFVLINFSEREECYQVPIQFIEKYYLEMYDGGRKSIPIADFQPEWIVDIDDYLRLRD